jgi:type III secretory pathway component EscV
MRLDLNDGSIKVLWRDVVRQEDRLYSSEDGAALPVRGGGIYDLVTCVADIPAGTTALTADMVTDLRGDPKYCGFCGAY